jgi:hypothetical protein
MPTSGPFDKTPLGKVGAAWHDRAAELAAWASWHLVNRVDCWGGYWRGPDGAINRMTRPALARRGNEWLTDAVLVRHFQARRPDDVVGLHTTGPANTSLWGALDIDYHGPGSTSPEANLQAALTWHDRLGRDGFRPLLLDSNGGGGFHLWIILNRPIRTPRLFHFLRGLAADHAQYGLPVRPEHFPKQCEVAPLGQKGSYGCWLRCPGLHHTRPGHWAKVWSGDRWLEGGEAVASLLSRTGDRAELVPDVPLPPPPPIVPVSPSPWTLQVSCRGDNRAVRAAAYLRRLPNRGEGQGRHDVAFLAACFLARDLALQDDIVLDWLGRWDSGNDPPLGVEVLGDVKRCADKYGRRAVGYGLGAPARPPRRRSWISVGRPCRS